VLKPDFRWFSPFVTSQKEEIGWKMTACFAKNELLFCMECPVMRLKMSRHPLESVRETGFRTAFCGGFFPVVFCLPSSSACLFVGMKRTGGNSVP